MQNQWFRNPDHVRRLLARDSDPMRAEKLRRRMIAYALFAGCKSGRMLRATFGGLCDTIVWEEASREIGGRAADAFPADIVHLRAVIAGLKPDVILVFGTIAADGLSRLGDVGAPVIKGPHPAARRGTTPAELRAMAFELRALISQLSALSSAGP